MRKLAIVALLFATPAFGQPQQPSAAEQALGMDLMQAIQDKVSLRAQLIEAQRMIAAKDARIKELEAHVPKPDQTPPAPK